jgi:hypothetical protein
VPGGSATVTQLKPKGRGRPKGAPPKIHPVIPGDEYIIEDIEDNSKGFLRRQRLERSAQQQAVDRKVLAIYEEWVELRRPTKWNDMPVKGWLISKEFEEEAIIQLGKAAGLHDKKLINGTIQRKPLPNLPLPAGKVRIPFTVVARRTAVTGVPGAPADSESTPE